MLSSMPFVPSGAKAGPIHSEPSHLLWGDHSHLSKSTKHNHSPIYFSVSTRFCDAPSLQDCHQCSCLCFGCWWPCPSCPRRTAAQWVSPEAFELRLSISHGRADWTGPRMGLRTWLASRVLNITTQSTWGDCLFFWLVFPISANEKIEDINGCPKNRSQMVSTRLASICVREGSPASQWCWLSWEHSHQKLSPRGLY